MPVGPLIRSRVKVRRFTPASLSRGGYVRIQIGKREIADLTTDDFFVEYGID